MGEKKNDSKSETREADSPTATDLYEMTSFCQCYEFVVKCQKSEKMFDINVKRWIIHNSSVRYSSSCKSLSLSCKWAMTLSSCLPCLKVVSCSFIKRGFIGTTDSAFWGRWSLQSGRCHILISTYFENNALFFSKSQMKIREKKT